MQIKDLEIGKEYMMRNSQSRFKILAFTSDRKAVAIEWEGGAVGAFCEGDRINAIEAPRHVDRFLVLLEDPDDGLVTRIFSSRDSVGVWLRHYPEQNGKIIGTAIVRLTAGEFAFPVDAEQQESAA